MELQSDIIYLASTWIIPMVIAITFHEAAHAYVALMRGDDTAARLGRVSLNPIKHIDPFGTILLPGILILLRAPVLFGYAKPVPVDFSRLRNPRHDMVLVAAAGPAINLALAVLAALMLHFRDYFPAMAASWIVQNLVNALRINVLLAVFNMLPIPPLDGGRIAVGLLPDLIAVPLARLEPYGMVILIGLLFVLPWLGSQLGTDLDVLARVVNGVAGPLLQGILRLTGVA